MGTHGLRVTRIINTHAHIDHIGAVREIREKTGAKFYLHKTEVPFVEAYDQQCQMFGVRFGGQPEVAYGKVTPDMAQRIMQEHVTQEKIVDDYVIPA